MATGTIILPILAAVPDATNPPALAFGATTGHPYLVFDSATDETARWTFRLPENFASSPVLKVQWSNSTTATGNAVWSCAVEKITPNSDTDDMTGAKTMGTQNDATDAGVGTRQLQETSITLTNFQSATAGDYLILSLFMDASADTIAEDCYLWAVSFEYTTT